MCTGCSPLAIPWDLVEPFPNSATGPGFTKPLLDLRGDVVVAYAAKTLSRRPLIRCRLAGRSLVGEGSLLRFRPSIGMRFAGVQK
jgi:hypothetical protein